MKKILAALMIFTSISASADCREAYEQASNRRDIRNEIIVGVAYIGTGTAAVILSSGTAAGILLMANSAIIGGAWPITDFKRQGDDGLYKNNFDKLIAAFDALNNNNEMGNKYLEKIIRKAEKKSGRKFTQEQIDESKELLAQGFNSELFCPVIKTRKDGTQKRAVFNQNALAQYLADAQELEKNL